MQTITQAKQLTGARNIALGVWLALGLLATASTARADLRVQYQPIHQANQCLPDAVGFQTALQVQYPGTWSRILKLDWNVKNGRYTAHAYCVYALGNRLYAYDSLRGQRQLDLDQTAKTHPEIMGRYLGGNYYGSAKYLAAFDPPRITVAAVAKLKNEPKLAVAN